MKTGNVTVQEIERYLAKTSGAHDFHIGKWFVPRRNWCAHRILALLVKLDYVSLDFGKSGRFMYAVNKLRIPIDQKFISNLVTKYDYRTIEPLKIKDYK